MSYAVLGVDPGVGGGMGLVRADGSVASMWGFSPGNTKSDLVESVAEAVTQLRLYGSEITYLEKVGYKRGDGAQGAFTFGNVFGLLEGSLLALKIQPKYVYPAIWQANLDCLSGGNKNVTKNRALEIFAADVAKGLRITHGVADALLIAHYGRRRKET